jgi:hypothetical protein
MFREDSEAFLRELAAPLSEARRGEPLPGIPFSREAVANAFVMLGLLREQRAQEILAGHRPALEAKGFRIRPGRPRHHARARPGRDGHGRAELAWPGRRAGPGLAGLLPCHAATKPARWDSELPR